MDRLDWDDLSILLGVARQGSLRLAAEKLRLSPATVSRRLSRLETHLGEVLVERAEDGCALTPFGNEVVAWAKAMEHAAHSIERLRDTQNSENLSGVVRVNTDDWTAAFLTARTCAFHQRFPNLEVEIIASQRPLSLARREADIAIRKRLPEDGQLRVRRVGSMAYGLYAASSYLAGRADAVTAEDWSALDFVGFEETHTAPLSARWVRGLAQARPPRLRCNQVLGIIDGVLGGAGAGVLAHFMGDRLADLRCLEPRIPDIEDEIWVVSHEALAGSARVKVVGEFLGELFRREAALLRGELAGGRAAASPAGLD